MHIIKRLTLRGHNIWSGAPMLEGWVDLGPHTAHLVSNPDDLVSQILRRLPADTLDAAAFSRGCSERFRSGMPLAEAIGELALLLKRLAGADGRRLAFQAANQPGIWKIALECTDHEAAETALVVALDLLTAALEDRPLEAPQRLAELTTLVAQTRPSFETTALLEAARARHIPVQAIGPRSDLRQLGHGSKQRRVQGLQSDASPAASVAMAADADACRRLLECLGIEHVDAEDLEPGMSQYRLYIVADRLVAAVVMDPVAALQSEVTSLVHSTVVSQAREMVRALGLAVASVAIATRDISQPLAQAEGGIMSVEAGSGLAAGSSPELVRRLADAVLESVYPSGATAHVPIVAVTGVNGKTTTTRLIAHILGVTGRPVGMTCTDGIFVGGERVSSGDCAGPQSARNILSHPRVEAAVLETARGGILREGVGFDHCDVAVVTNIGEGDHLGLGDITTVEQLARVKRTIVEAVGSNGAAALNAEDPLVLAMAPFCPGAIILFAVDAAHEAIVSWRQGGGRAVIVRDGAIAVAEGDREFPLLSLDRIPLTHQGRIRFQMENALAAVAATWSLGIPVEVIRTGLETFIPSADLVPGRFNLLDVNGAAVVFDYGHNATALRAILESLKQFPHERRLCVYSAAGDRRDVDLIQQGTMIGDAFDNVVLYEDYYMRGREPGEIIALFGQGLLSGSRVKECRGVQGWTAALEAALQWLRPGDLALIQADTIDSAVAYMKDHLGSHPTTREVTLKEVLASGGPAQATQAAESAVLVSGVPVAAPAENRVLTHP